MWRLLRYNLIVKTQFAGERRLKSEGQLQASKSPARISRQLANNLHANKLQNFCYSQASKSKEYALAVETYKLVSLLLQDNHVRDNLSYCSSTQIPWHADYYKGMYNPQTGIRL